MPDASRTHDLQSRSLMFYPAELRAHKCICNMYDIIAKISKKGKEKGFKKFLKKI